MTSLQNRMRSRLGATPRDREALSMPQRPAKLDPIEREIEAKLAHLREIRKSKRTKFSPSMSRKKRREDNEWVEMIYRELEDLIALHAVGVRWAS